MSQKNTITIKTDSPVKTHTKFRTNRPKKIVSSKTITINTGSPRRTKPRKNFALLDNLHFDSNGKNKVDTKTISVLDPKETKCHIILHWRAYTTCTNLKIDETNVLQLRYAELSVE